MFEVDRQWIERVHQCIYKSELLDKQDIIFKLKKLQFKFFNLDLEDKDYEEFDLIEEKINNKKWED
jgi:hypothetical protein